MRNRVNLGSNIELVNNILGIYYQESFGILRFNEENSDVSKINTVIKWPDTSKYEDLSLTNNDIITSKTIKVNEKARLNIYYSPMNAFNINKTTIESSNTNILTVNKNGQIKVISKGSAYVIVKTSNGITKKIKIKVTIKLFL